MSDQELHLSELLILSRGGYHYLADDFYGAEPDLCPGLLVERGPHAGVLSADDLREIARRIEAGT